MADKKGILAWNWLIKQKKLIVAAYKLYSNDVDNTYFRLMYIQF